MEEKSKVIFGNPMPDKVYRKAVKSKKKYAKKSLTFFFCIL